MRDIDGRQHDLSTSFEIILHQKAARLERNHSEIRQMPSRRPHLAGLQNRLDDVN
jgi:hypothetical protein